MEKEEISSFSLAMLMLSMLALGTGSTMARKAQDETPIVHSNTHGTIFKHPYY